ncbi:site-specific integrase [Chitinophaga ginsengisoli]|uniref:Site-specific recombinase XerD n=1 Tax=Chitinophaga ginsengisoli TaxID=363837 RepID=A0A2P8FC35_9BACT|nr:site-specific integrase [Chitinophaga ginsengisoli]PSL19286.1 site-specific recombinase XerD [Chitinophaga ginsengisoli]
MNVKQNLSVLVYRKKKNPASGMVFIYLRVTIDGISDEITSGIKVKDEHWDKERKQVTAGDPDYKKYNKTLELMKADLQRHFDLVQALHGLATPKLVLDSYRSPINGKDQQQQKIANLAFSERLDALICDYIKYCRFEKKAYEFDAVPSSEKRIILEDRRNGIKKRLDAITKEANTIFDNKSHHKTLVLAIDEYLLNFLLLAFSGNRSPNSLEKMIGRKNRYLSFIRYRYKADDLAIEKLEYKFIADLFNYLLVQWGVNENSATKYCQCLKEIIDRAVANGWLQANIFGLFRCSYVEPDKLWPSMDDFVTLLNADLSKQSLREIRDINIFCGMTGLAYQEVFDLSPRDIVKGSDGELWIEKKRQKTDGDVSLPLLPLALEIIEQYKDHPLCLRRNRLLPVPTNQAYNRGIKEIATETGINIINHSHQWRYFFANEVVFNNGVDIKTTGKMLSHKSVKTTEIYVKANKRKISESMGMVKEKLFGKGTELTRKERIFQSDKLPGNKKTSAFPVPTLRIAYVANDK